MNDPATPAVPLRHVVVVVALGALVLAPSLFTRGPWNPDEPRYQEVAREMGVRGDYLVPHLNGEPYSDKPPVFFWLAAGLWHLGFGLASGRVVALLLSLGTLLVVYDLGRRFYDAETGLLASLVTLTTLLFAHISRYGVLDPPLTFFVVTAIWCAVRALHGEGRPSGAWWLGFYAAAALGLLTKGPVALAVPGLVALGYGLARRREVRGGGWWHLGGAALLVVLAAAWLVPAALTGGEAYADDLLLQQTLRRVAKSESHREAPYFYLMYAPGYFFPWALILPLAFVSAWRAARREGEAGSWLPVLWFAIVFVFFTAFSGKRERYLLPIVPAVGLLCGRYVRVVMRSGAPWPRWHTGLWRATLVALALVSVAASVVVVRPQLLAKAVEDDAEVAREIRSAMGAARVVPVVAATLGLVAAVVYGVRLPPNGGSERKRVGLAIAAVVVLSLVVDLVATPVIDRFKSGADLITEGKPYLDAAEEVYLFKESFSGVYNLHTRRTRMPVLERTIDLARALAADRRVAVIGREGEFLLRRGRVRGYIVAKERVGHRRMAILANWQPEPETPQAP